MTEQEVREHIGGLAGDYKCYNPLISHEESLILHDMINKPEPHWIPVTERLPETELQHPGHGIGDYLKSDMVAVSGDFDYGDKVWIACYCDDLDGETYWSDMDANTLYNVIAWMPLPEPYKGVTE